MSVETPQMWKSQAAAKLRFFEDWLLGAKRATYGLAMVRILFGLTALGFLAANWLNRHYLWGNAGRWIEPVDDNAEFSWPFTFFYGGSGRLELELKLAVVAALLVLLVVGWRARIVAPVVLVLWTSLLEAQPIVGDQSDNIFRILLFYLCFADISRRWSLDARRRAKQEAGEWHSPLRLRVRPEVRENFGMLAIVLNNLAVVAVAVQLCLIYVASGLYKVQGELWQDGTGVYYPMQMGHYAPWPWLNDLLSANALGVMVATYFSVFIQIFFPLLLLRRLTRVIALLGIAAMHLGIGVAMGLPFFSLVVISADMIFIRDSTYRGIEQWARQWWQTQRDRRKLRALAEAGEADEPDRVMATQAR
ncbi:HTTM domain-containing protein [Actinobacteria bacterium YIM 96077]|uniref:HTTM domain-containing protein n=1 Tax=Phytoactinopolyspora halophila TaxID=1981511 RepID=A0A329QIH7_9ACTN|nr:HTTM domain-containing protein [Phytoactinopolyspora halophila]AYY12375.1 HTTM domain-containing protein [Actinobacteria bacterium YIM 96077]RAW12046.1 HTTM domain-containing protein [Phytoactinopolyspora halophila]